ARISAALRIAERFDHLMQSSQRSLVAVSLDPFTRRDWIVERGTSVLRRRCLLAHRLHQVVWQLRERIECRDAHTRVATAVDGDCRDRFEEARACFPRHPTAQD